MCIALLYRERPGRAGSACWSYTSEGLELMRLKAKYTDKAERTYLRASLLTIVQDQIEGAWDDVC